MGIIARFRDIMEANFNALLDRAEDPEKMIDQYLRDLEEDLAKVKAETASVMAEETKAKRALDECIAEITKMQSYAERAVIAGRFSEVFPHLYFVIGYGAAITLAAIGIFLRRMKRQ